MQKPLKQLLVLSTLLFTGASAFAKLPAPVLTDEAKAKAAEAVAKTAWSGKVANYQLCKSQDQAAAHYYKVAKANGKDARPAPAMPACADPGAFVYTPAVAPAVAPADNTAAAVPAKKS